MADAFRPAGPAGPATSHPTGFGTVAFDRPTAERVRDATLYVERMSRGGTPAPRRGSPGSINPGTYAVATSDISAASGLTLGKGTIRLCTRDDRVCAPSGDDLDCYNAGGDVPSGTLLSVSWVDGDWSTGVGPCADDSLYGGY